MKSTFGGIIIGILIIGIFGGLARYFYETWGPGGDYQAVLLTTGDVYFAKVSNNYGKYVTLRDVYYPQVPEVPAGVQAQIQLIKFGGEIHGPTGEMEVNRDHVVMIQPLRLDSQVVETIESFTESQ